MLLKTGMDSSTDSETPAFRISCAAGTDVPTGVGPLDESRKWVGQCPNVGWAGEGFRLPIGARDGARTVGAFAVGGVGGTDSVDTSSSFIGLTGGCAAGDGSGLTSGAGVGTESRRKSIFCRTCFNRLSEGRDTSSPEKATASIFCL